MPDPAFILDYASPRKRSKFRLSSTSLIESRWSDDGVFFVREWLGSNSEQALAATAIVMSTIAIGVMLWMVIIKEGLRHTPIGVVLCVGVLVLLWMVVLPLVIQQTWRETLLEITVGALRLKMGGPFSRQRFSWRLDEIQAIRVIPTQAREGAPLLAEIEILADGSPPIRLFTDHTEPRLAQIGAEIDQAMKRAAHNDPAANSTADALRRLRG